MYKKKNKGITIVSLVIMIILLILLVGILIQSITNTGIFEESNQQAKVTKRTQIEEWLGQQLEETQNITEISDRSEISEEIIKATRQKIFDNIDELKTMGKKVTVEETSTEEDGEQVEIYFYVIVDKDVYKVSLMENGFIGEVGKFRPVLGLRSITETTNSITVQVMTKRNKGGEIKYYIKTEDEEDYTLADTKAETETTYTYTGLEPNKSYIIKIVAIAENKQKVEIIRDVKLKSVTD